jgi:curved DNA-binding protein CbpA
LYEATTYKDLRDIYFELIKKHHPDVNGDTEINKLNSQILNDTYFELKAKFGKK